MTQLSGTFLQDKIDRIVPLSGPYDPTLGCFFVRDFHGVKSPCLMKDCLRRSSRADGVQHSGRPSQGAGRECDYAHGVRTLLSKVPIPITILIPIQKHCQYHQYRYQCRHNTNTSIFHQNFYPSFDHPDHAGTIECNFVLGKADDHFQSWWVINYRISWCITFHMPIPYWQWHVITYQYYIPCQLCVWGRPTIILNLCKWLTTTYCHCVRGIFWRPR